MSFNEFEPGCGWIRYRKRMALKKKMKSVAMALFVFAVYAAASTICENL